MAELTDDTAQTFLDQRVREQVMRVAARLRDTADRIDRLAGIDGDLYAVDGYPQHHKVVSRVLSEWRGMLGNTMLDGLVEAAAAAETEAVANGYNYNTAREAGRR